jgi:hypothetical protein
MIVIGALGVVLGPRALALGLKLVQRLADARRTRLRVGKLLEQLVAAGLPKPLVLGGVDCGLFEDPPRLGLQPLVAAVGAQQRVGRSLVESIATVPTLTIPACAQSANTSPNSSDSAS